jgi:hypothetical protein
MQEEIMEFSDLIRVKPHASLIGLSKADKHKILDSALQQEDSDGSQKGLSIKFTLSSSGRRINNRIYTIKGHLDGLKSWTQPYNKPVIYSHDTSDPHNIIGRITDVRWVGLDDEAKPFFRNPGDLNKLKDSLTRRNPQAIYKILKDNRLLSDPYWPGLGRLLANAKITDQVAIEKFLDERFLNFSAGSQTDGYTCGICGTDWYSEDMCEHLPGKRTDDGDIGVFVTGVFHGREASIVTEPGDTFSQLISMKLLDSAQNRIQLPTDCFHTDQSSILISDLELGESTMDKKAEIVDAKDKLMKMEPLEIVDKLSNQSLDSNLKDALMGDNYLEVSWLIRIHDALHSRYDYTLRYHDQHKELEVPADIFKLHGKLHELSQAKDFRGAMINGQLDYFDSRGASSEEYVLR